MINRFIGKYNISEEQFNELLQDIEGQDRDILSRYIDKLSDFIDKKKDYELEIKEIDKKAQKIVQKVEFKETDSEAIRLNKNKIKEANDKLVELKRKELGYYETKELIESTEDVVNRTIGVIKIIVEGVINADREMFIALREGFSKNLE